MTHQRVVIKTSLGDIELELYPEKAPKTVANFIKYINKDHYVGTIFHRVIQNFMIQGGGFTDKLFKLTTEEPIDNEANNGLSNDKYTIAMARTNDPHSATAQFFINVFDNIYLNHSRPTPQGWGYAVFGKVINGFDVVDKIACVKTRTVGFNQDVPVEPVVIHDVMAYPVARDLSEESNSSLTVDVDENNNVRSVTRYGTFNMGGITRSFSQDNTGRRSVHISLPAPSPFEIVLKEIEKSIQLDLDGREGIKLAVTQMSDRSMVVCVSSQIQTDEHEALEGDLAPLSGYPLVEQIQHLEETLNKLEPEYRAKHLPDGDRLLAMLRGQLEEDKLDATLTKQREGQPTVSVIADEL